MEIPTAWQRLFNTPLYILGKFSKELVKKSSGVEASRRSSTIILSDDVPPTPIDII